MLRHRKNENLELELQGLNPASWPEARSLRQRGASLVLKITFYDRSRTNWHFPASV